MKNNRVTIGVGKGVEFSEVRSIVRELRNNGYEVHAPFYIMNELGVMGLDIAKNFVKECIEKSDIFYVLKKEEEKGLLKELREFAELKRKVVIS